MESTISVTKPLLSIQDQIQKLQDNGITFDLISIKEASDYLRYNNYFFKLTAFRKNYVKNKTGKNIGKYDKLDFAYLKDLAIIDMELRYLLIHISLDVERFTKLYLLNLAEDHQEDGYQIISDYFDSLNDEQRSRILKEMERSEYSIYSGDIYHRYNRSLPIWVFLELVSFGRLVDFYRYCGNRFNDDKMIKQYYLLKTCKDLRNATAHSSCLINDLNLGSSKHQTSFLVTRELGKIESVSKITRDKKMSNARLQQIVTLLYMHKQLVTSEGVRNKAKDKINGFITRMNKNKNYYLSNALIRTSFEFLEKVIDMWF